MSLVILPYSVRTAGSVSLIPGPISLSTFQMKLSCFLAQATLLLIAIFTMTANEAEPKITADAVIQNANVITVDGQFSIAQAVAIRGDKILAVGNHAEVSQFIDANTRV